MQRPIFNSVRDYSNRFTDAAFWRPYVEEVCRRHDLDHSTGIRSGMPGTHPVFLIGEQWVIKCFSDLFNGARSFGTERECYHLLANNPAIPAAKFVAEGSLFPSDNGWQWPYLVSTQLPGISIGAVWDRIEEQNRELIARELGHALMRLHHFPLDRTGILSPDWTPFCNWLREQRNVCVANHRQWKSLPEHLIDQIDGYLPDVETLIDKSTIPLLLHCDMNADHLLGDLSNGYWTSTGIIDFGDARVGDFHYELAALHLGLFQYDPRLLRVFLHAYGSDAARRPDFARHAMSFALLHEFNVLEAASQFVSNLGHAQTLSELANWIWHGEGYCGHSAEHNAISTYGASRAE